GSIPMTGEVPPTLGKGRYCFTARAWNLECRWFAEASRIIDLPTKDSPIVLGLTRTGSEEEGCGERCVAGQCVPRACALGEGFCGLKCVSFETNQNCGACGATCFAGWLCQQGQCCVLGNPSICDAPDPPEEPDKLDGGT